VFGKVLAYNIKTQKNFELIDQAQAHKRKIKLIRVTKDYVFTAAADQRVKQWSIRDFKIVWSGSLDWIPTSLTISNDSAMIGGPSVVLSLKLDFYDKAVVFSKEDEQMTTPSRSFKEMFQGDSVNPIFIVLSIVAFLIMLSIVVFIKCFYRKSQLLVSQNETSESNVTANTTQTLVTQILKISLPGYKEFAATMFRVIRKLTEGGGGIVHIGEALSFKCSIYGKTIIVKIIAGKSYWSECR
jgi:hypothetical protein